MDFSPEGQPQPPAQPPHAYERTVDVGKGIIPLTDFKGLMAAQMLLAQAAFPGEPRPMNLWVEEQSPDDSLASRFRAYVEDPERKPGELELDPSNVASLLEAVRAHPPESLH